MHVLPARGRRPTSDHKDSEPSPCQPSDECWPRRNRLWDEHEDHEDIPRQDKTHGCECSPPDPGSCKVSRLGPQCAQAIGEKNESNDCRNSHHECGHRRIVVRHMESLGSSLLDPQEPGYVSTQHE